MTICLAVCQQLGDTFGVLGAPGFRAKLCLTLTEPCGHVDACGPRANTSLAFHAAELLLRGLARCCKTNETNLLNLSRSAQYHLFIAASASGRGAEERRIVKHMSRSKWTSYSLPSDKLSLLVGPHGKRRLFE